MSSKIFSIKFLIENLNCDNTSKIRRSNKCLSKRGKITS